MDILRKSGEGTLVEPGVALYWAMVWVKIVFYWVIEFIIRVVHCIEEFGVLVGYIDCILMYQLAVQAGEGR